MDAATVVHHCASLWCRRSRILDCVGVVGSEGVQVAQLTKATLDVGHVDFYVVLEGTANTGSKHFGQYGTYSYIVLIDKKYVVYYVVILYVHYCYCWTIV